MRVGLFDECQAPLGQLGYPGFAPPSATVSREIVQSHIML
jgi:hypothetical protein